MKEEWVRRFIRHGLYPVILLWVGFCLAYGITNPAEMKASVAIRSGVLVGVLLLLEIRYSYRKEWGPSWKLVLGRDAFFILVNGLALAALQVVITWATLDLASETPGLLATLPLGVQVPLLLVAFESLYYPLHRVMHLGRGPLTNHLWRAHAIHHLPGQLYLVIHAVFHPFNALLVRLVPQLLPLIILGPSPAAVFVSSAIVGLHGTISHLNLDFRMGVANYLFVGPELHRYHHSASTPEAKNFSAILPVFDLVFGTFHYRPGTPPKKLGLSEAHGYPGQIQPLRALLFPLSFKAVGKMRPGAEA